MRIGLFGGTFDPPHAAHRAACLLAMRRLGLDRVWWLVTPGNPLKDTHGLTPLAQRVAAARALAHHPRIDVTDLEADLGTSYTYATIRYLVQRCPGVHFVWITICATSTAGSAGATLRRWCRSRWSTGSDQVSTRPPASPEMLWPGPAYRKRRPEAWRCADRRHGFFCMG
jgi:Cytidylyltransferase-like